MRSMPEVFEARLFDGVSAKARHVPVTIEDGWLRAGSEAVPLSDLRQVRAGSTLTLHRTDRQDWRLMIPADHAGDFRGIAGLHAVTGRHLLWIAGSAETVALIAALLWLGGPTLLRALAPRVPAEVARSVGEQYVGMFAPESRQCRSPAGRAALDRMVARLVPPHGLVEPVTVTVVDDPTINAFAVPGGQVILYRGLINQARSPEEVAGVLAHEFGHVQRYHANQALIRHFGLGIFIEGLGGDIGSLASTGLFLTHTRTAEREADEEAARFLRRSGISSSGLANFFSRMGGYGLAGGGKGDEKGSAANPGREVVNLLSTHPPDRERQRFFAQSARSYASTPVLSPAEWKALQEICSS
jgi:predicted Zn-dependent protease